LQKRNRIMQKMYYKILTDIMKSLDHIQ